MGLPEHYSPSSDRRIATWIGALAALTAGAVLIRRRRV
jgi:LPXTG-motif cell wall-anchored protein